MRKCFFFQASHIVKEVRCIHLTNLYSLCEQVARSSTPSTKQKLNQLKLFFQKGKVISPQFQKNGIRRMWFFNLPKIGYLYYVNTDQLQYVNNRCTELCPSGTLPFRYVALRNFALQVLCPSLNMRGRNFALH